MNYNRLMKVFDASACIFPWKRICVKDLSWASCCTIIPNGLILIEWWPVMEIEKISLIWLKTEAGVSLRSLIKTSNIVLGVRGDGRGSQLGY